MHGSRIPRGQRVPRKEKKTGDSWVQRRWEIIILALTVSIFTSHFPLVILPAMWVKPLPALYNNNNNARKPGCRVSSHEAKHMLLFALFPFGDPRHGRSLVGPIYTFPLRRASQMRGRGAGSRKIAGVSCLGALPTVAAHMEAFHLSVRFRPFFWPSELGAVCIEGPWQNKGNFG